MKRLALLLLLLLPACEDALDQRLAIVRDPRVLAVVSEPAEAERVFHALAENGKVKMAIAQTFWSSRFGMLIDQFGTPWMVNCEQVV